MINISKIFTSITKHKKMRLAVKNGIPIIHDNKSICDYATMIAYTDYEKVKEKGCNTCKHQLKFMCTKWNECKDKSKYEPIEQEPCDDVVSRQTVKEQMIKYGFHAPDMTVTEFVEDLLPVRQQEPCYDAINRILKRMWNCRGKHTTSIDKVKMEQIIREELSYVAQKQKIWH